MVRLIARGTTQPQRLGLFALALLLLATGFPPDAAAQRPVRMYDPFYRDESARRTFFDRYAFTAEVSYRPAGAIGSSELPTPGADPFGFGLRFDYRIAPRFDLGVLVDATGSASGRKLSLNWITAKYYRTVDTKDYAFRLAVDPSIDGRSGFPQADLAFLYTALVGPTVSTDFGIGMRRVRIGFQELVELPPLVPDPDDPLPTATGPRREVLRSRALGWEVHLMHTFNLLFDPAGSNLFVTFLGEGGVYDLVEWSSASEDVPEEPRTTTAYRGGVLWTRTGIELNRPSLQFAPYLAVPLQQWAPDDGEWPRSRLHIGLSLTLR